MTVAHYACVICAVTIVTDKMHHNRNKVKTFNEYKKKQKITMLIK